MKTKQIPLRFLLLISAFVLVFAFAIPTVSAQPTPPQFVPGKILVKFKDGTPRNIIEVETAKQNAKEERIIDKINVHVLTVPTGSEARIAAAFSQNPLVEYAEQDGIATADMTVNDPSFPLQWGLENSNDADIDASTAWDNTTGNGAIVAVLDTGISTSHPDLATQVIARTNFSDSTTDDDVYGHGTHVGGIIAALTNNGMGVAGVCPTCKLYSVKVLNDSGSGAYSWIASGIRWATDNHAKVINMSLGGSTKSRTLEDAVNYAWNNGVVLVAAAGNSGNTSKSYPGAYTNVIAVAATDSNDRRAAFSEYGSWVDVAAPGVTIYSTWNDATGSAPTPVCNTPTECYKYASGTSMATPMAAGVVGLIWGKGTYTTATDVRNRLELTADKIAGTGTFWKSGRVNADHAVGIYTPPSPTPTRIPTPTRGGRR